MCFDIWLWWGTTPPTDCINLSKNILISLNTFWHPVSQILELKVKKIPLDVWQSLHNCFGSYFPDLHTVRCSQIFNVKLKHPEYVYFTILYGLFKITEMIYNTGGKCSYMCVSVCVFKLIDSCSFKKAVKYTPLHYTVYCNFKWCFVLSRIPNLWLSSGCCRSSGA